MAEEVVVGGGVVGLTTALTLLERSPGLQVNPVKRPLYIAVHSIQVVVLADGWNADTTSSVAAGIFLWGPPGPDPDTELEWARHSWNWYQAGLHTVVTITTVRAAGPHWSVNRFLLRVVSHLSINGREPVV